MEAAGLVLGAIPLMFTALEKYQKAGKLFRTFKQVDTIYKRILRDLEDARQTFRLRLRGLPIPLAENGILEDDELDNFMAEPGGAAWTTSDAEATFALMRILDRENGLKLRAISSQKVAWEEGPKRPIATLLSRANLRFQAQGVKLALQNKNAAQLLDEIKECNSKLDQMLDHVDREKRLQRRHDVVRSRRSIMGVLAHYWKHVDRIYRLLASSWQCACVEFHHNHVWPEKQSSMELSLRLLNGQKSRPADELGWSKKSVRVSAIRCRNSFKGLKPLKVRSGRWKDSASRWREHIRLEHQ